MLSEWDRGQFSESEIFNIDNKHLTILFVEYRFTRPSATVYWYLRKPKEIPGTETYSK